MKRGLPLILILVLLCSIAEASSTRFTNNVGATTGYAHSISGGGYRTTNAIGATTGYVQPTTSGGYRYTDPVGPTTGYVLLGRSIALVGGGMVAGHAI